MPPPQQQRHYLINNHIIQQSNSYKNSTLRLRTMIRPPTIITTTSPLQINCSDGHHQHDQRNRRKTPLLQLHHHYCCITVVQQSHNVRFSARRIARRWRQCYLIPPSLMQPIIINNIKQAPPLDVRRQEIIYYNGGRENGGEMMGEIISTQPNLLFHGGEGWKDDTGNGWFGRVTQQSTINKLMLLMEGRSANQTITN